MDNFLHMPSASITAGKVPGLAPAASPQKYIAVADIGRAAAVAFGDGATWTGRTVSLAGDNLSGEQVAAIVARVRGKGETFRWAPASRLALRFFAPEMYKMSLFYESPGYSDAALTESLKILPDALALEEWLKTTTIAEGELPSGSSCVIM